MSAPLRAAVTLLGFVCTTSAALRADEPPVASAKVASAKARAEAAGKVYRGTLERSMIDPAHPPDPDKLYRWSRRWMEAELEVSDKKADRTAAAEAHLERMKKAEAIVTKAFEKGMVTAAEVAAQTYFRLETERDLARVKDK